MNSSRRPLTPPYKTDLLATPGKEPHGYPSEKGETVSSSCFPWQRPPRGAQILPLLPWGKQRGGSTLHHYRSQGLTCSSGGTKQQLWAPCTQNLTPSQDGIRRKAVGLPEQGAPALSCTSAKRSMAGSREQQGLPGGGFPPAMATC